MADATAKGAEATEKRSVKDTAEDMAEDTEEPTFSAVSVLFVWIKYKNWL